MPTPMQESSYQLLVRTTSVPFNTSGDWRRQKLVEFMHEAAVQVNTAIVDATTASDRTGFVRSVGRANAWVRRLKVLLQALDELGMMLAEDAHTLHSTAESVQRLIMAAMKTAKSTAEKNGGLKLRL